VVAKSNTKKTRRTKKASKSFIDVNFYGFDHDKVREKFSKDAIYLGTWEVLKNNKPLAIYYTDTPDTAKGHKNFFALYYENDKVYVTGFERDTIEGTRYQTAIKCKTCEDRLYSLYRHDYRDCSCGESSIDGGAVYTRIGGDPERIKMDHLVNLEEK